MGTDRGLKPYNHSGSFSSKQLIYFAAIQTGHVRDSGVHLKEIGMTPPVVCIVFGPKGEEFQLSDICFSLQTSFLMRIPSGPVELFRWNFRFQNGFHTPTAGKSPYVPNLTASSLDRGLLVPLYSFDQICLRGRFQLSILSCRRLVKDPNSNYHQPCSCSLSADQLFRPQAPQAW